MTTTTAIDKITRKANRIKSGKDKIEPGQPVRISEAASVTDFVRQGDLYLIVAESVPSGYTKATKPQKQLVPGTTQGARHCLDSLDGVTLYVPKDWSDKYEGLDGPCFVLAKERTVEHPTHGVVHIPAGFTIQCRFQREWDQEQKRERRNAD